VTEALNLAEFLGFPKIHVTVVTDSWSGGGVSSAFSTREACAISWVWHEAEMSAFRGGWVRVKEAFSALPWRFVIDKRGCRVLYKEITARVRRLGRRNLFAFMRSEGGVHSS